MIQQSAILNDTDITDNDDSIEKKIVRDDRFFHPDLSLINIPSAFELKY